MTHQLAERMVDLQTELAALRKERSSGIAEDRDRGSTWKEISEKWNVSKGRACQIAQSHQSLYVIPKATNPLEIELGTRAFRLLSKATHRDDFTRQDVRRVLQLFYKDHPLNGTPYGLSGKARHKVRQWLTGVRRYV